jgi:hypothetical protein
MRRLQRRQPGVEALKCGRHAVDGVGKRRHRHLGGTDEDANLQALCGPHNRSKGIS